MARKSDKTLKVTITVDLKEPLTKKDQLAIIRDIWEHVYTKAQEGTDGFVKIDDTSLRDAIDVLFDDTPCWLPRVLDGGRA